MVIILSGYDRLTDGIGDYITSQGLVTPFFDCRVVDENLAGPATTRFDNPGETPVRYI